MGTRIATTFLILLCLAGIGLALQFHPAIKETRNIIPEDVYVGTACDCQCILESRPWYGKLNYWFWLWVITIPLCVFSISPNMSKWLRAARTVFCIGIGHILVIAFTLMSHTIRNGPFSTNSDLSAPEQKTWDMVECFNVGDGASNAHALMFGWLLSLVYVGWVDMIWYAYHKNVTKQISSNYKRDIISKIAIWQSALLPALFICVALLQFTRLHL